MEKSFAQVIMNPVRQRIVQHLMLHPTATVATLSAALADVPRPSLYRHMSVLLRAGCVRVVSERAVRGAAERTYALVPDPLAGATDEQLARLIQGALMSVAARFAEYFASGAPDPQRDMLSVSSSVLMLTDAEFADLSRGMGEAISKYIQNEPAAGRRARNIVLISAPTGAEGKEQTC